MTLVGVFYVGDNTYQEDRYKVLVVVDNFCLEGVHDLTYVEHRHIL